MLGRTVSETLGCRVIIAERLLENNFADGGVVAFQGFIWLENPSKVPFKIL